MEDEPITALAGSRLLERHDYTVIAANSGEQAVQAAAAGGPMDLVLMDIDLGPGMDGTRAAEEILKTRDVPVLFLSSHTEPDIVAKTERITSYGYVVKNSGDTVLLASIKMAFRLHRAHLELRRHEERFSDLARSLPETVFETDMQGRITFVNEISLERFGYTMDDVEQGLTFLDMVVPEDHRRIMENVGRVSRGEDMGINEYRVRRKDGSSFPALVHANRIVRNGRPVGISGFVVDISYMKNAEDRLKKFQHTIDRSPDIILWLNRDGGFEYVNDQACRSLGYSREELLSMKLWDIDPLITTGQWQAEMKRHYEHRQGGSLVFESAHRRKDGTTYPVEVRTQFLWYGDRTLHISSARDISARKLSDERHRTFLKAALDGFVIFNMQGRIIEVNDAFMRMSGYSREELLELTVYDLDANFTPAEMVSHLEEISRSGSTRFETRHYRKDRTTLDVEVSVRVMEHEENLLFVFIRDITDRKKAEAALEKSLNEKEALLLELQHRMKNSLAMITGLIGLEMERPENSGSRPILESVRTRIDSLGSLYSLLHRSESAVSVRLDHYIESVVASLTDSYMTNNSPITIERELAPFETDTKKAAAWGLIVNELLTNSLKHAIAPKQSGVITIRLAETGGLTELSVSDNGIGPPEHFDIDHAGGFGILLVKMLAGQLNGALSFDRDCGNTFYVRVPGRP